MAKDVFEQDVRDRAETADEIVAAEGLAQIDDESQIVALVGDVLAANRRCRWRSTAAARPPRFGFLVGQVMKATARQGQPEARQ